MLSRLRFCTISRRSLIFGLFTSTVLAACVAARRLGGLESPKMKSIALALAAILATTSAAWATTAPAPITLTHNQLIELVQRAEGDPHTTRGFVGAHIALDLRPISGQPFFAAVGNVLGLVFICQNGFEDFGGGPVAATLSSYERGEDGRDFVKLDGCTALER